MLPGLIESRYVRMSWPENPLAVPEVEVDIEKSCAKDGFGLFLLFVFYLNGISIFRY